MLDVRLRPVPLARLDNHDRVLMDELLATVSRVASSAAFTGGAEVDRFEEEFSAYCGAAHAVGVGSGTDALHLGLRALGVGPGDEVVVPANSFIATAEAVSLCGAVVRFADVDSETGLMTADTAAAVLGPHVRAIVPVHLHGRTVDLGPLLELAERHGIHLVEDACQAHGAWYRGRRVGSLGAFGAFSFYPAKNLGAWGDGGALITDDGAIADRVRLLRSHGERPRYRHRVPGMTSRLDGLQAAILRVKLRRLDGWNAGRRRVGAALARALAGAAVQTPAPPSFDGDHVFHQFVVLSDRRDELRAHLEQEGIATGIHYPVPIHRTEAYGTGASAADIAPVCTGRAARICSLPLFWDMDAETMGRIAGSVARFG